MSAYAVFEVNPNPDATVEQLRNYDEYKSQVHLNQTIQSYNNNKFIIKEKV